MINAAEMPMAAFGAEEKDTRDEEAMKRCQTVLFLILSRNAQRREFLEAGYRKHPLDHKIRQIRQMVNIQTGNTWKMSCRVWDFCEPGQVILPYFLMRLTFFHPL
tara:strand:- start:57 stop:371 length:315 start_codon:yes stop_codon:yes gene_type:complete